MKIALAQMNVVPGDPRKNIETMKQYIYNAKKEGTDIIAFPEMCISGYLLGDKWLDEQFCNDLVSYNNVIEELSTDIAIIWGNIYIEHNKVNKDGRKRKYNSAYAWYNGKPLTRIRESSLPQGITVKTLLPNYRIFDDERYFFSLMDVSLDYHVSLEDLLIPFYFEKNEKKMAIGIEICEDIWFNDYAYNNKPLNVSRLLIENGAQSIFNISSSPWTYGKDKARKNRLIDAMRDSGAFVPFFYVNCVGVQNNGKNIITFDGDSTIYNKNAEVVQNALTPHKEELLLCDMNNLPEKKELPIQNKARSQYLAALAGIRSLDQLALKPTFPFIIGLSGGVDSALVACLVSQAVGSERLLLFNLPSKYNSDATKNVARHIAEKLGAKLDVIPIESLVNENANILKAYSPSEFNMENIQAKIRGSSILSNIAGIKSGMMTCNGNKVEIALGYATLYGDVNGAIAPIGDLLKTEVFELCRYMNEHVFHDTVIPLNILPDENYLFEIPPSAELKNAQVDPMKWGYHDALVRVFTDYHRANPEDILSWYYNNELAAKLDIPQKIIELYGLNDKETFIKDLEWVVSNIQKSVFKRIQSPPIIIMSKGAYGYDVRESQLSLVYTKKYEELRKKILGHE